MRRSLFLFLIMGALVWAIQGGLMTEAQAAGKNWQYNKAKFTSGQINNFINPVCYPVDARNTVDPHNCFLEQYACAKDNSGYGKCVTKNCKWGYALDGDEEDAVAVVPFQWNWYCNMVFDSSGATAPQAAPMPPPDCSTLGDAWTHHLSTHPACQAPSP